MTAPRVCCLAPALAALLAACAGVPEEPAEPVAWSDKWFRCDSSFECIAVYDAFCRFTAVNDDYSLVYLDWARQTVQEADALGPCDPVGDDRPLRAWCREQRCEYP